jgi:dihydrofolate reductase
MGAALILGRKTLESIGIALPGRETIVVTRADSVEIPNIQIAHSLDEAFQKADETGRENVYVCGGGEIYRQAIDDVERIYATEVGTKIEGADTFFPDIDKGSWRIISKLNFQSGEKNIYPYSLVTYERADNE